MIWEDECYLLSKRKFRENANIINPKKRINDVKIIDLPVWFMVLIIESSKLLLRSSFLNFARK